MMLEIRGSSSTGSTGLAMWIWKSAVDGDRKKAGEMRVRPRFSVDGCGQNSRLLRVFKSLGVEDLMHVIIHHTDSAGLPLSPPLFFGLRLVVRKWRSDFPGADVESWIFELISQNQCIIFMQRMPCSNRCFGIAEEKCNAKESRRCSHMICATAARQSVNSSECSVDCVSL
jgi:hypothetical protein